MVRSIDYVELYFLLFSRRSSSAQAIAMTTAGLASLVLGVLLLSAMVLTSLPDHWYDQGWYRAPTTVFGGLVLVTILLALFAPHA